LTVRPVETHLSVGGTLPLLLVVGDKSAVVGVS
jgi:hypothetical protein